MFLQFGRSYVFFLGHILGFVHRTDLTLAVSHPVEADMKLQVDRVRHLHLHLRDGIFSEKAIKLSFKLWALSIQYRGKGKCRPGSLTAMSS